MSECRSIASFLLIGRQQRVTLVTFAGCGFPRIWLTLAIGNVSRAIKICRLKFVIRSPVEILHVLDGAVGKLVHEKSCSTSAARGARPRIPRELTAPHAKTDGKVVAITQPDAEGPVGGCRLTSSAPPSGSPLFARSVFLIYVALG